MDVRPPRHDPGMWLNTKCAGCDQPGDPICRTCRIALLADPSPPLRPGGPAARWDRRLREDDVVAAVAFAGRARQVVLGLKYRNRTRVAPHLAGLLVNRLLAAGVRPATPPRTRRSSRASVVADSGGARHPSVRGSLSGTSTVADAVEVDVVTWAPTSARRRRERGFDQAEVVARHVAAQLGLPCRRLLERVGNTPTQTGRGRVDRLHGTEFRVRPGIDGARVLLVDDVVTTGATLRSADAALRAAGVDLVVRAAIAATPSGVGRRRSGGPGPRPRLVA